jgi:hypothetical protein
MVWVSRHSDATELSDGAHQVMRGITGATGDAAWRQFTTYTESKAVEAGSVVVGTKNTMHECSRCGAFVNKELKDRVHSCNCGITLDRDENAATNTLRRGRASVRQIDRSPSARARGVVTSCRRYTPVALARAIDLNFLSESYAKANHMRRFMSRVALAVTCMRSGRKQASALRLIVKTMSRNARKGPACVALFSMPTQPKRRCAVNVATTYER